jgi:hypothetical protein
MSLDVTLTAVRPTIVWEGNITHNLVDMAMQAGVYTPMWHPEKLKIHTASELIPYLEVNLPLIIKNHKSLKKWNPPNGWGSYENLLKFTSEYLDNCKKYPDAKIDVSV